MARGGILEFRPPGLAIFYTAICECGLGTRVRGLECDIIPPSSNTKALKCGTRQLASASACVAHPRIVEAKLGRIEYGRRS